MLKWIRCRQNKPDESKHMCHELQYLFSTAVSTSSMKKKQQETGRACDLCNKKVAGKKIIFCTLDHDIRKVLLTKYLLGRE